MPQFPDSSDKIRAYSQVIKAPHKAVRFPERVPGVNTKKHATMEMHIYARAEVQYSASHGTCVRRSRLMIETTSFYREEAHPQVDSRRADKDKAAAKYRYEADKDKAAANHHRKHHITDKDKVAANHQNKADKHKVAAKPHSDKAKAASSHHGDPRPADKDRAATYRHSEPHTTNKDTNKAAAKHHGKPRAADKDKAAAKYQKETNKDKAAANRHHK